MREKKLQLVITCASTSQAIHLEQYCQAQGLPGRLIPVPSQITAGCGLAWKTDPNQKDAMIQKFIRDGIAWEAMHELFLYTD